MVKPHYFIYLYFILACFNSVQTMHKSNSGGVVHLPPKQKYKNEARLIRIKELKNKLYQKQWQLWVKAYECGLIKLPLNN